MSKYIDNEELRKEIIVSFGKGDLTPNAKLILIQMINSIFRRLMPIEQIKRIVYQKYVEDKLFGTQWKHIDVKKVKYETNFSFAYFTEIIKRNISKVYTDKEYVDHAMKTIEIEMKRRERQEKLIHLFG